MSSDDKRSSETFFTLVKGFKKRDIPQHAAENRPRRLPEEPATSRLRYRGIHVSAIGRNRAGKVRGPCFFVSAACPAAPPLHHIEAAKTPRTALASSPAGGALRGGRLNHRL